MASQPQPSWVILGTPPRVAAAGELQAGASVSLALAAPPRVTQLTVGPTVFPDDPDPQTRITSPHVIAADPSSGLFLVVAPPPVSERPPTRARAYRGPDGVERTIHVGLVPQPACFVLDVPSAAASRLSDAGGLDDTSAGAIASPGGRGGGYMVAELQIIVGCKEATLVCFESETGEWVEKDVRNPRPHWIWSFDDVVSHDGKLWWVDLAKGLLACDPFADQPEMAYFPLPKGAGHGGRDRRGCSYCSQRNLTSRRCVQISNGKFHCVQMSCARQGGAPSLSMFMLDPEKAECWTPKYTESFSGI